MKYYSNLTILLALVLGFLSCSSLVKKEASSQSANNHYAEGFKIDTSDSTYTKVTVYDPWNNYAVHSIYYLTRQEGITTPIDGLKVQIPVQSVMVNSATYLSFIELLEESDKITGVCSTKYIYSPLILNGVENGSIQDLGESFNLDTERLLMLNPDIILTAAYSGDQKEAEKFRNLKQRPVFNLEWQERSLLGRAEWVKFIAAFFDKQALGDSIFQAIETNYLSAKNIVDTVESYPTVFSGQDFRGSWSLPGEKSYAAQLFRDAKMDYSLVGAEESQGSVSSSIEEVLLRFHDSSIWVNVQAHSLDELLEANDKYRLFKAYLDGRIYNNRKRTNSHGGNDYWESGVARPDLLLKDMIKIAHPEVLPDYELTFMEKLN